MSDANWLASDTQGQDRRAVNEVEVGVSRNERVR